MGFFSNMKRALKGKEKQVDAGIDKTADTVDEKTGAKYTEKIDTGAEKAKEVVDKIDD